MELRKFLPRLFLRTESYKECELKIREIFSFFNAFEYLQTNFSFSCRDLSHNKIKKVAADSFHGLKSLETLYVVINFFIYYAHTTVAYFLS